MNEEATNKVFSEIYNTCTWWEPLVHNEFAKALLAVQTNLQMHYKINDADYREIAKDCLYHAALNCIEEEAYWSKKDE